MTLAEHVSAVADAIRGTLHDRADRLEQLATDLREDARWLTWAQGISLRGTEQGLRRYADQLRRDADAVRDKMIPGERKAITEHVDHGLADLVSLARERARREGA